LVASTGALLRASGLEHERLLQTQIRTPLGEVVVARLEQDGAVEVAGPSAAADVRAVSEAMSGLGARQVLIDGAIDRRAASAPAVAEGLVMATGAVLGERVEDVVAATAEAVELARLPLFADGSEAPVAVGRRIALGGRGCRQGRRRARRARARLATYHARARPRRGSGLLPAPRAAVAVVVGVHLGVLLPLLGQLIPGEAGVHRACLDAGVAVDALL